MYILLTQKQLLYTYKLHLSTKNEINLYDKITCQFCYSIIACDFDWQFESGLIETRGVARGGGAETPSSPDFGRSVNPIQTMGADYARHTTALPAPRIQNAIYTSGNNT